MNPELSCELGSTVVVHVAVSVRVVGVPFSVSVTVVREITTTDVGVGLEVTVTVGRFNIPFDNVRVRVTEGES